jgi:hypothetical protein
MTKQLSITKAMPFLNTLKGRIFGAAFIKKDGSVRTMSCRLGVKSYIKGTGSYTHSSDLRTDNIDVFEMGDKTQYRAIPLDRVLHSTANCVYYRVV